MWITPIFFVLLRQGGGWVSKLIRIWRLFFKGVCIFFFLHVPNKISNGVFNVFPTLFDSIVPSFNSTCFAKCSICFISVPTCFHVVPNRHTFKTFSNLFWILFIITFHQWWGILEDKLVYIIMYIFLLII